MIRYMIWAAWSELGSQLGLEYPYVEDTVKSMKNVVFSVRGETGKLVTGMRGVAPGPSSRSLSRLCAESGAAV